MRTAFRVFISAALILLCAPALHAQGRSSDFPDYAGGSQALCATPGTQGGAAAGFWNPAAWAAMKEWELSFLWNDRNIRDKRLDNWGLFMGGHGLGFAMRRSDFLAGTDSLTAHRRINDYQIALGGGSPADYWGLAYSWSRGDKDIQRRDHSLALGNIARPFSFLSIGNAAQIGLNHGDYRGISDLGLRPLRNHRLTLFGDAAYGRYDNASTMQWGAGVEVQPLDGIRVAGKLSKPYADDQSKIFTVSFGLTLDELGFQVAPHYDKDSERMSTSYLFRLGSLAPSFDSRPLFEKDKKIVSVPMKGELTYQKARWGDANRVALWDMLELIEKCKGDPTVSGVLLNLSGFETSTTLAWELREKLRDLQSAGKKVYIYLDHAEMREYYLASVADLIIMDPIGVLAMPGYVMGRTYWKGFLEKLGLGVEEWRYFTYKSAFESFARRDMSPADREQRLALVEELWTTWQSDVASARELAPDSLRALIDSVLVLRPQEAKATGLVDTVAGWDEARDIVKEAAGKKRSFVRPREVRDRVFVDPVWGEPPKIAVVYAVGECDMEKGIRGRATSRALRNFSKRKDVKAVVLRADSPGGDALPSDLVARQMKKVSEKKPMIVSQGRLAASGGYWISMNGDRIFTAPTTFTGSIGVIGGWLWNQGFSDKTGFTSDHVKAGKHAELGFGVTLPLIGATIPDRNLTDDEKARIEHFLRGFYSEFTHLVAEARDLTDSYVDSVGQGRVWTGKKAVELKLADEIGGLEQAVNYARDKAKLRKGRFVIEEYPRRPLLSLDFGQPFSPVRALVRLMAKGEMEEGVKPTDYELSVLKRISANPGQPLPMMAPEDMPIESRSLGR